MTTQHAERPDAPEAPRSSYDLSKSSLGEIVIVASDPVQPSEISRFVARDAFSTYDGYGVGPVFSMSVNHPTVIN